MIGAANKTEEKQNTTKTKTNPTHTWELQTLPSNWMFSFLKLFQSLSSGLHRDLG